MSTTDLSKNKPIAPAKIAGSLSHGVQPGPGEVVRSGGADLARMSPQQVDLLKATVCRGATDDELRLFVHVANRTGLDPFTHQIHAVKRWDSDLKREVMAIQTGIDGYRLIAERTGQYRGGTKPEWCDADGLWSDVWLSADPPAAARVSVYREGYPEPVCGVGHYRGYVQRNKEGHPVKRWRDDAPGMLAKCAEALALRRAFPQDLSGLYVEEEMGQAEEVSQAAPRVPMPSELEMSTPEEEARSEPHIDDPSTPEPSKKKAKSRIATDREEVRERAGPAEWTGRLAKVTTRSGKKNDGSDWILWTIHGADGKTFGTFEKSSGQLASDLNDGCFAATIYYEQTERGNRILEIRKAGPAAGSAA